MRAPPKGMEKLFRINFVCPECRATELIQLFELRSKTIFCETSAEELVGVGVDYKAKEIVRYECGKCGFEPPSGESDLYNWLEENEMLELI